MKPPSFLLKSRPSADVLPVWLAVVLCWGFGAAAPATAQEAPMITVHPVSQHVSAGSVVNFSVTAVGDEPLIYHWYRDGVEVVDGGKASGATLATLTVSNVQGVEMGAYSVRVSNAQGAATSAEATLRLEPLVAWGRNDYGQATVPVGLTNIIAMAAGTSHNLVVRGDGTVVAWGRDDGYYGYTSVPVGLSNITAVAAGSGHSLALRSEGSVVGWGNDSWGQATPPAGLTNAIAIAAGAFSSLALRSDGTVTGWGSNSRGQTNAPADLRSVVSLAAGGFFGLALRSNGTVAAWGAFDVRGLYPAVVPEGLSNVVAIAAGTDHALALLADRTVVAWGGENYYMQTNVPVGLTNVVQIDAGGVYSLALRMDGSLVMWSGREFAFWEPPTGLSHVVAIAAGGKHALALVDFAYYPQLSIRREAANVAVSWTGGRGPFQIMQSADLSPPGAWENLGEPVTTNAILLPFGPDNRFLRVLDLAPRR